MASVCSEEPLLGECNMEDVILLSQLNDFIFCPVSIYFHNLYGPDIEKSLYQGKAQIAGTKAHETIDEKRYSKSNHIIMGMDVFCEKYRLSGKIDMLDLRTGCLTERKKRVKEIYDGYIFQLYGQYFSMKEMGYNVKTLRIYSMDDQRKYDIPLPEENTEMLLKFEQTINNMRNFKLSGFTQDNPLKCRNCIYEPACDRGLI